MKYKRKTIDAGAKKGKTKYIDLYSCRIKITPRKLMHTHGTGQIYKDKFPCRKKIQVRKRRKTY